MTQNQIVELIGSIQKFAYNYALKLSNYDKEEAEDLVQDTNVRVLRKYHTYEHGQIEDAFKRWYCTIMRNISFDRFRLQQGKGVKVDVEYAYYKHVEEGQVESSLSLEELRASINRLDPKKRQCFELIVEGYKYDEVATMLNININTVKIRVFYARQYLQKRIFKSEK